MPNYNKVLLMGNLTRDPELRYTPNNTAVVNIGIAVNRRWRDQSGEQRDETTFVDCEAWSRTAELINQWMRKGRPIFIEGRLRLDQWQDKDGNNRSKLKVVIDTFQFIDSRGEPVAANDQERGAPAPVHMPEGAGPLGGPGQVEQSHASVPEDDIPF